MPINPIIGRSDQGLTSTAAGEMLLSSGPGGVPIPAVPGTDFSVPTAAERWTGAKTHAALQRVDWTGGAWTGGIFKAISPPDSGVTPDFNWSFATASVGQSPQDHIINLGWNSSEGGSSADSVRPSWSIQFESAFYGNYSETVPQFEWHLQFTRPDTAQVIRSVTATALHDGSHCDIGFAGDETYFRNHTGVEEMTWAWPNMFIHSTNAFTHATNNVRWLKQRMTTGVDASLIRLGSSDIIRIGESQVPSVKVAFDSPISQMTLANPIQIQARNAAGADATLLQIDAANSLIVSPISHSYYVVKAGTFYQLVSAGFNPFIRADPSGLALGSSGTSDGTQKLGFFGATPIVKPSGELVAALTNLGLASSIDSISLAGPITVRGRSGPITSNTDAATVTFDLAASDQHELTMDVAGSTRTLALGNEPSGSAQFNLYLTQDDGTQTVAWWSGIKWVNGTPPVLSTTAGAVDTISFRRLRSGAYLGYHAGPNMQEAT